MKTHLIENIIPSLITLIIPVLFATDVSATTIAIPGPVAGLNFEHGEGYYFSTGGDFSNYIVGQTVGFDYISTNTSLSARGVVNYTVPSVYLTAGAIGGNFTASGRLTYFFSINSEEDKEYDIVVKSFGKTLSNTTTSENGYAATKFYGELSILGDEPVYQSSCSANNYGLETYGCGNPVGEAVGVHNTFGEKIITMQSNKTYMVMLYAQINLEVTGEATASGYTYVDPEFSLLDPSIKNVTFQFSDGIENMAAPSPVPAPAAALLFATGLPIIGAAARRKKQRV